MNFFLDPAVQGLEYVGHCLPLKLPTSWYVSTPLTLIIRYKNQWINVPSGNRLDNSTNSQVTRYDVHPHNDIQVNNHHTTYQLSVILSVIPAD